MIIETVRTYKVIIFYVYETWKYRNLTSYNRFCIISSHPWNRRIFPCPRGLDRSMCILGSRDASICLGREGGTSRRFSHHSPRIPLAPGYCCCVDNRARWPRRRPPERTGAASSAPRTRGSAGSCSTRSLPAWRLERKPLTPTTTTTRPAQNKKPG